MNSEVVHYTGEEFCKVKALPSKEMRSAEGRLNMAVSHQAVGMKGRE
jgi:hypothetical protein